ncbi:MAG TPA: fibronectin type III domain-containing protein, partial [Mycobacterium sp.]|nr:fibronectin type III domain-containing protein [Mycobacterium sp.]
MGASPLGAPFNIAGWGKQLANAFSSSYEIDGAPIGDPDTPILRAYQGDPVRVHVLQSGDRARMVETEISGHNWLEHAFDAGSVRAGVQGAMATGSAFTFYLQGAGGDGQNVGDYKYGVVHAMSGMSAGSWGILRVYPTPAPGTERDLSPLETSGNPYEGGNPIQVLNQSALGPDTVAPTVKSVDPVDAAPGVKADAKVTVKFSESIKAATVTEQSLRLSNSSGDIVPSTTTLSADLRTATVTPNAPLAPGAGYSVNVSAVVTDLAGNPLAPEFASTFTVAAAPPGAPTDVVATPGDRSATVSWTPPVNDGGTPITGYRVDVFDGSGTALNDLDEVAGPSATSVVVDGLAFETPYRFTVTALNAAGVGAPSAQTEPITLLGVPDAPNVTVVVAEDRPANNGMVTVSWTAPKDNGSPIVSYIVRYGADDEFGCMTNGMTCFIAGLTGGVPIAIRVAAMNEIGDGPFSADVTVTPLTKAPAPQDATATAGDASAVVSWTAPESDGGSLITSYDVRVLDDAGQPMLLTGCSVTDATSCTVTGLTNGVAYSFTVTATNAAGTSAASPASAPVTPVAPPSAPTAVTGVAGDGQVTVTWAAPTSTGGSPITGYTVTATPGAKTCQTTGTLTCTVPGLTNGTAYTFTVTATNAAGTSTPSKGQIVTPVAPPSAPTTVKAVAGNGQVTVTWAAPSSTGGSPITGYTVTASPGGKTCQTTGELTCTVQGLTNSTAYTFTVTATNAAGTSAASAASAPVTPVAAVAPAAPTAVKGVAGNGQVTVTWAAPAST